MSFDMFFFFISVLFYTVLGLCVGSFLNVVIYRLPIMVLNSVPTNTMNSKDVNFLKTDLTYVSRDLFVQIVISL